MNAIFITEKEAREFIGREYGEDARLKSASITSDMHFDIDEVPYPWGGETAAFDVNHGEALVGYMEEDNEYRITYYDIEEKADSLYAAREIAAAIKREAEDLCVFGVIEISDRFGFTDEIEVDNEYDDEPGDPAELYAKWQRLKIGKRIKDMRLSKALSIRELAALAGLSKNHIVRIEEGRYNYTVDTLTSVANALGISIEI